jgi:Holliday junction DNA helicase RuvA
MFYHINGIVCEIQPLLAVVDCGGVGYALNTTNNTLSRLKIGEKAKLYTYLHVREESFELFGFYSLEEKSCFEMLIGVSGVGPKAALSILSASTPEALALAIIGGDEKALTVAPGIGKKIAQRIILELKDKMTKQAQSGELLGSIGGGAAPAATGGKLADASAALAVLGYAPAEISAALKGLDVDSMSLEDIIRQALKRMMK